MIPLPFQTRQERDHAIQFAKDWLESAPESGYCEIEISPDRLTVNINKEALDLLSFLRDEGGIEYEDPPVIILCG